MTTVTVSLSMTIDSENLSVIAKLQKFIAELNGVQIPLITLDPITGTINKPLSKEEIEAISIKLNGQEEVKREKGLTKTGKVRKAHKELNEEAKQVIRVRFANGRIAAAKARGEEPRQQDLDTVAGAKLAEKVSAKKSEAADAIRYGLTPGGKNDKTKKGLTKHMGPAATEEVLGGGILVETKYANGKSTFERHAISATEPAFVEKVAQAKKTIAAKHVFVGKKSSKK